MWISVFSNVQWFACGPANSTAIPSSLSSFKFNDQHFCGWLIRLSWKGGYEIRVRCLPTAFECILALLKQLVKNYYFILVDVVAKTNLEELFFFSKQLICGKCIWPSAQVVHLASSNTDCLAVPFILVTMKAFQALNSHKRSSFNCHRKLRTNCLVYLRYYQWRNKVAVGPHASIPKGSPLPKKLLKTASGKFWAPHSAGPACTARLARPIVTPLGELWCRWLRFAEACRWL